MALHSAPTHRSPIMERMFSLRWLMYRWKWSAWEKELVQKILHAVTVYIASQNAAMNDGKKITRMNFVHGVRIPAMHRMYNAWYTIMCISGTFPARALCRYHYIESLVRAMSSRVDFTQCQFHPVGDRDIISSRTFSSSDLQPQTVASPSRPTSLTQHAPAMNATWDRRVQFSHERWQWWW